MTTPPTSLPGQVALEEHDPALYEIIQKEKNRQSSSLEMIASENITSRAVRECLGSCLTNKYAEGYPGVRYYGGNQYCDEVETLCQERALKLYGLDPEEWAVNVQPYSGSPANFEVLSCFLQPHDRLMGLHLPHGGHLTHGYQLDSGKKISKVSYFFESMPYFTGPDGLIDYDGLEATAKVYRPKMLIAGYSAYPRDLDYDRFKAIADAAGSMLMVDIAHYSGFVATGLLKSPFAVADVVTTTTHKSLRGPRSGMIFVRKMKDGKPTEWLEKLNFAVFPGLQGGPHMHQIAAVATQLKEVATPEFKVYSQQVLDNCQSLAKSMVSRGMTLATGGTENHIVLWDCRPYGLTGSKVEKVLEAVAISVNKNTVPGDKSALTPGGIRIGAGALTTRGMKEPEMDQVAEFYNRAIKIGLAIQEKTGKPLKAFLAGLPGNDDIAALKADVQALATKFPMPGPQ